MDEAERIAVVVCPECRGECFHEWMEAVCCRCPLPDGECCSQPIGELMQAPCEICGGSGVIEERPAVRTILEKRNAD